MPPQDWDETYTYDRIGNRQSRVWQPGVALDTLNYVYEPGTSRIDSTYDGGAVQYTHDADGNETGWAGLTFDWSERGEMVKRTDPVDMQTYWYYRYDGLGRRVRKHTSSLAPKTYFLYDPSGRLVYEMVFDSTQRDKVRERRNYYYLGDRPFGIRESGAAVTAGNYWLVTDHLNTPWKTLSSTGTSSWSGTYYPFGGLRSEGGTTRLGNLRFPGQYHDRESGLYYNVYRYYRGGDGRYTSVDRYGEPELSSYSYAASRPTSLSDPFGTYLIDASCPQEYQNAIEVAHTYALQLLSSDCLNEASTCGDCLDDTDLENAARDALNRTHYYCSTECPATWAASTHVVPLAYPPTTRICIDNIGDIHQPLIRYVRLPRILLHEALHNTRCPGSQDPAYSDFSLNPFHDTYLQSGSCIPDPVP